jgi:hypothetical protein
MAETGVLPCGEAVHGLEPQLTIYVCVVRRCWSEPFDCPEVFHKFATLRASEGASNTRNLFPARIVISATINGTDSAISRRSDLRVRHEKKRRRFYRLSGSKAAIDKTSMVEILLGARSW